MEIDKKIIPIEKISQYNFINLNVVTTNGIFDILHLGHLSLLNEAKKHGDLLWVGVNSDNTTKALKGDLRPYNDELTRARQLASLQQVDYVTIFDDVLPNNWISLVKPALHVKGGDYTKENLPEYQVVKNILIVPTLQDFSTTNLEKKIVETYKNSM